MIKINKNHKNANSYLFSLMHLHQYGTFAKLLNKKYQKKTKEQKETPQCKSRN